MSLQLAPVRDDDLAAVRAVLHDPTLAGEFEAFLEPGHLEHKLADALRDRDATLLARDLARPNEHGGASGRHCLCGEGHHLLTSHSRSVLS